MRITVPRILAGALCLALALLACSSPKITGRTVAQKALSRAAGDMASPSAAEAEAPAQGTALAAIEASQPDRYLIKDARITIEVDDAQKAAEHITTAGKDAGGYAADMRESTDSLGRRAVTVQVRVPSDRFESYMKDLDGHGKTLDRHVSSQDITEEYVDTDAAVRNLKRTEERLLDHLQRTAKLEDILNVERELTRVRGEIERHEGRLRFLSHRVAYSTITAQLIEKAKAEPIVPPKSFSTVGVASSAVRSVVAFAQQVWIVVIWVAVWAVVWAPAVIVVWWVGKRIRRAGARHANPAGKGPSE